MHMEDPTNLNVCILQDSIKAFNLSQHVKIPTHNKGHTLDVIITTNSTGFNNVSELVPGPYISDHRLLILETTINKLEPQTITTKGRKPTKNINNIFKEKFNDKEVLNSTTLDDAINHFTKEVLKAIDDIAPLKKVNTTNRKPKPWYDEDLKQQRTIRKNRERKWMKYHEDHLWKAFVRERNRHNTMLKFKKNACLHKIIKTNSNNTRKLYKLVSELTGSSKPNPMPDAQSDKDLAEGFAQFFRQKIDGIQQQFNHIPQYIVPPRATPALKSFTTIAENDLLKLIMEMPTKTCENDIIPTKLLKEILPTIIPSLTKIANLSINKGVFSEKWKSATVKPLIKSQSKGTTHQNYRPVSNLTFLSKVVEKITLNQFTQHCEDCHLLQDYQSAYRKHHSCEASLIKLVNDLLWAMEKQEVTAMTVLDLSAAFDTVDHDLPLAVLDQRFGVKGTALKWYEQYLKLRKFKVTINNTYSNEQTINYSVPQGSIQGAFLFNAYASMITEVIPLTLELMGYADDHLIRKPFKPGNTIGNTESDTITIMEDSMLGVSKWMNEVRLKLNKSKTDFIYFGSKHQLKKCTFDKININSETIQRSDTVKYLGGHLDQNLNFRKHVITKCKAAMMNIWKIRLIRKFLTRDICHQLTLSLAISHLNYSNAILIGCPDTTLSLMQKVQNTAARMVLNKH